MSKNRAILALVAVVALSVLSVAVAASFRRGAGTPSLPTAIVTKSTFVDFLQLRGDIKAVRSVVLTAPSTGADLQIVDLAAKSRLPTVYSPCARISTDA